MDKVLSETNIVHVHFVFESGPLNQSGTGHDSNPRFGHKTDRIMSASWQNGVRQGAETTWTLVSDSHLDSQVVK